MKQATRYRCKHCSLDKFLPESPLNPTRKAKTGCDRCDRLTMHFPVGNGPFRL